MDPNRAVLSRTLFTIGGGLLSLGIAVFLIKVLVEMAYVVAGAILLVGVGCLVAGALLKKT
jgi:hypothetical protein